MALTATAGLAAAPAVSVVVAHYDQQGALDLVMAALELQHPVPGGFEVVVADDGSPQPPLVGERPYPVRLVRHRRDGFRLAATRNLGAAATRGRLLCFLDADTVPTPGYLAAMVAAADGRTLLVGRRRHADLAGLGPADVAGWLQRGDPAPPLLDDPAWLADGYAATDDLARADDASFRFVIGAVMAVPRALWSTVGGFDESFRRYGGEDWDLAQRCWLAGADLRHLPQAVAWHDGPDLAGRADDLVAAKNAETVHLARTLTHPLVRGAGALHAQPDIVVHAEAAGWTLGQAVLSTGSMLTGSDAGVWLDGAADEVLEAFAGDPRVHRGAPPAEVLARCRTQVRLRRPVVLTERPLREVVGGAATDAGGDTGGRDAALLWWRTRDLGRHRLGGDPVPAPRAVPGAEVVDVPPDAVIERWRGGPGQGW